MNLKTFELKRIINDEVMMTEPTIWFNQNVALYGKIEVDEYHAGRIDLIANEVYGNPSYADYILKYNNIANPFSINVGDILYLPVLQSTLNKFKKPVPPMSSESDSNLIRDKFMNTKRLPVEDQKRIEYLKRKAAQYSNGATEILPPNVLKPGASNVSVKDGIVKLNATIDLTK